jgi:hypothetical protein
LSLGRIAYFRSGGIADHARTGRWPNPVANDPSRTSVFLIVSSSGAVDFGQLIRSARALNRPDGTNCVRLLTTKFSRREEPPRRSAASPSLAPAGFQGLSHSCKIRPFSPSYGHSLDKTVRSAGG